MYSSSAVSDYYMQTYPKRLFENLPLQSQIGPTVVAAMDPEVKELLRRAIALLEKVDARLGDVDCMDAEKAAFIAALGG